MKLFFGVILLGLLNVQSAFALTAPEDTTRSQFKNKEAKRLESLEKLLPAPSAPASNTESKSLAISDWLNSDEIFRDRLALLNNNTPFELLYNEKVKAFIKLYAIDRKETTSRILALSEMYFPLFEETLQKYELPDELKYLAVVESALHAKAKSHAAAVGLWQFIPGTGKLFGLKINSLLDERSDPIKATEAACRYLKSLYNLYANWELALAAYNSGPGNVNKAIRLSGGKRTYWDIYDHLPRETRSYVPAFIAVNYVMTYYKEHNIKPATVDFKYFDFDTIIINQNANLAHIASTINEPLEVLQFLNPSLKTNNIPASSAPFALRLPKEKIEVFAANNSKFKSYAEENLTALAVEEVHETRESKVYHKVKKGETLAAISRKYNCSVNDLRKWNKLSSTRLSVGQKIAVNRTVKVKVKEAPSEMDRQLAKKSSAPSHETALKTTKNEKTELSHNADVKTTRNTDSRTVKEEIAPKERFKAMEPASDDLDKFHVVEKGDTLWSIAKKYEGITVAELKKLNNLNNTSLKPGQKLLISIGG